MLVWFLYGIGYLLTLYVNRFLFCLRMDRPEFLLSETRFAAINMIRIIIAYGSIGWILWKYSTIPFVMAAMAYVVFTKVTRIICYHRYVRYLTNEYKEIELERAKEEGREISDEEATAIAYKTAKQHIEFNAKYNLF